MIRPRISYGLKPVLICTRWDCEAPVYAYEMRCTIWMFPISSKFWERGGWETQPGSCTASAVCLSLNIDIQGWHHVDLSQSAENKIQDLKPAWGAGIALSHLLYIATASPKTTIRADAMWKCRRDEQVKYQHKIETRNNSLDVAHLSSTLSYINHSISLSQRHNTKANRWCHVEIQMRGTRQSTNIDQATMTAILVQENETVSSVTISQQQEQATTASLTSTRASTSENLPRNQNLHRFTLFDV